MSKRIILISIMLMVLAGCSVFNTKTAAPQKLLLLPPNAGPEAVLLKQKITMEAQGEKHQFLAIVRLEPSQSKLRALLPTGQTILSLDYDGKSLVENNLSSVALPSEEILAMMQFALWPIVAVQQSYSPLNGWNVEASSTQRQLSTSEGMMLTVDYVADDEILIEHYPHRYKVTIILLEEISL